MLSEEHAVFRDAGRRCQDVYPSAVTAWTMVLVLAVANVFSFIDRQILALLIDPIRKSLAIDDFQISLLIGPAFALFYGTMGIPLGWAVDRYRRMQLASGGIALWSLMTMMGGVAATFPILLVSRVGVGVGEATLVPAANSIIADSFPPDRRTRAMGFFAMSIYVGSGLALIFGGLLVALVSSGSLGVVNIVGRQPWQMVLIMVGAPGLLVAAIIALLPEPARHDVAIGAAGRGVAERSILDFFRSRASALWCHFLGYSALILLGYSLGAWAPSVLIREYGWSASSAGLSLGLAGTVAGVASILAATWVADRLWARGIDNAKFRIGLAASLCGAPCAALMAFEHSAPVFILSYGMLTAVAAAGIGTGAAAVQQITPNQYRGRVLGTYLLIASLIGSGLGPPAVALLSTKVLGAPAALSHALALTCAAALVGAVLSFSLGLRPFAAAVRRRDDELRAA